MLKSVRQQNDVNELSLHCKLWTDLSHYCRLWISKFRLGCNHGKDSLAFWPLYNKNEVHCVCPFLVSYAKSDILVNTSDTSILSYFASLFFYFWLYLNLLFLKTLSYWNFTFSRFVYPRVVFSDKADNYLDSFLTNVSILYPLKTSEVFGYKLGVFFG